MLQLTKNCVIKFGKISFLVREVNPDKIDYEDYQKLLDHASFTTNINKTTAADKLLLNKSPVGCKICLEDCNSDENPLIDPCDCAGSIRYMHVECLKLSLLPKKRKNKSEL